MASILLPENYNPNTYLDFFNVYLYSDEDYENSSKQTLSERRGF